jgi:uncharacterized membrane protein YfcA
VSAFGGLTIVGILLGSRLVTHVPQEVLKRAFAVLLLLVAATMLWQYATV